MNIDVNIEICNKMQLTKSKHLRITKTFEIKEVIENIVKFRRLFFIEISNKFK